MKKELLILAIFLMGIASVFAQESPDKEIEAGKSLVESKKACEELNNEQLESIGDYYMEQMHPGEAHEIMDNMMGGEGSKSLKQVHINMAKRLYCNENVYVGYGMMNMMGGGVIGNYQPYYSYSNNGYWNLFWIAFLVAAIIIIALLVYKFGIKKADASETLLSILKKRLARGEITKKQFDDMKRELEE